MSDIFAQVAIFVLGPTAIVLSNMHNAAVRRWAPVVGLSSQPFWFWTTAAHHQWPVFLTSIIYTAAWLRGLYNQWYSQSAISNLGDRK
jgi:hypothetical protein